VMRSVARRVNNFDVAAPQRERLSTFKHSQISERHGQRFAKQVPQFARPKPLGAGQQFRRVCQVQHAGLVDVHLEVRIFFDQSARGARMVQMNMREQDSVQIRNANAA